MSEPNLPTDIVAFGARLALPRAVTGLRCADGPPYALALDDGTRVRAKTVVIASGARYRRLDVPDAGRFDNLGLHYAATALEASEEPGNC